MQLLDNKHVLGVDWRSGVHWHWTDWSRQVFSFPFAHCVTMEPICQKQAGSFGQEVFVFVACNFWGVQVLTKACARSGLLRWIRLSSQRHLKDCFKTRWDSKHPLSSFPTSSPLFLLFVYSIALLLSSITVLYYLSPFLSLFFSFFVLLVLCFIFDGCQSKQDRVWSNNNDIINAQTTFEHKCHHQQLTKTNNYDRAIGSNFVRLYNKARDRGSDNEF